MVEILQQQGHRLALAEPLEETEHGLEHARFAPLGGRDARARRQELQLIETVAQPRHEPGDRVARRAHEPGELVVRQGIEKMLQRGSDGRVRDT